MDKDSTILFPWFLGPKAENADFFEDRLLTIVRDYVHWRRNYFPGDNLLISKRIRRTHEGEYDDLESKLTVMSAQLRRNFPFYSPRYIGHQLSEVSLPSMLGTIAGLLFNPNNVTPEAAPVTVEWEIEACNLILEMLGYRPPPVPPKNDDREDYEAYERKLRAEFGWAHITSGGTSANIEALWVARSVRYSSLALRDAVETSGVQLDIKMPDGKSQSIKKCSQRDLLLIKPNEAIFLLGRFVKALRDQKNLAVDQAAAAALDYIRQSRYAPGKGFFAAAARHPPVLFVSGAAHYSIQKAANVLGIGPDNVIFVETDSMFRLSMEDLEAKIRSALAQGKIPLAVVGIVGTTEEGAVDPIHEIVDLRHRLEKEGISFWLHVDAAWAGFFASLFRLPRSVELGRILDRVGQRIQLPFAGDVSSWHRCLAENLLADDVSSQGSSAAERAVKVEQLLEWLDSQSKGTVDNYVRKLYRTIRKHGSGLGTNELRSEDLRFTRQDRMDIVKSFVSETIPLDYGDYQTEVEVQYAHEGVLSAFLAISQADSTTVDPHKMGYTGYPCGVVAFRNDRVRHFVTQRAPYITGATHNVLVHQPPRHLDSSNGNRSSISIDAFAPFILEGSKPGSAAAGLYLATQTIPLRLDGHGQIIRSSILAARELYEWLTHWRRIARHNGLDQEFSFVPFNRYPPDTNIVVFAVRKRTSRSLRVMNNLTKAVYEHFSIQAELGDREYSYAQPFFLSRTKFEEPHYGYRSVEHILSSCDIRAPLASYREEGVTVLRATVMNPYITPLRQLGVQNLLREFMEELVTAASAGVEDL